MRTFACCSLLTVALLLGCQPSPTTTIDAPATTPVVNVNDQSLTKLAEADQLDGEADKVVHRCYSCALGMDGNASHAVKAGDYTVHFCSEACSEHFVKDPDQLIAETDIPSEDANQESKSDDQ